MTICSAYGFVHRNFRAAEWSQRAPKDLSDAADGSCLSQLPPAADPAPNAADLGLVRGRVTNWLTDRIVAWRAAAPTTITRTYVAPLVPPAPLAHPSGQPGLVACSKPDYPNAAIRSMAQGTTTVDLDIDDAGHVVDGRVASSSGSSREHALLDAAALAAMRACTFNASSSGAVRHARLAYKWALTVEDPAPPAASH